MPDSPSDRGDSRPGSSAGTDSDSPRAERVISTRELLAGGHRVWIEHAAQRYLLQVTRSGKLILTK
jgi:hemin uptake protein HemP